MRQNSIFHSKPRIKYEACSSACFIHRTLTLGNWKVKIKPNQNFV